MKKARTPPSPSPAPAPALSPARQNKGMLVAQNLTLAHRLKDISTLLQPGQVTAICGPNGAGKSSLLSALAGLLAPEQWQVLLDGQPLSQMAAQARARRIGYLPQSAELAWDISVETLVTLGRLPWGDAHPAIDDAIIAMALAPLRHRPFSTLSGGEQARAMLARVLAGRPEWILADEPLANLDIAHAKDMMQHFRRLAADGTGVVTVLHDLAMAMNHADRVLVLNDGELLADGPPAAVLSPALLAQVWQIKARWLGDKASKALSII